MQKDNNMQNNDNSLTGTLDQASKTSYDKLFQNMYTLHI
jgi:hypothetical protein